MEILYVQGTSGSQIRANASLTGKRLGVIPFGTSLSATDSIEHDKYIWRKCFWPEENITGWVAQRGTENNDVLLSAKPSTAVQSANLPKIGDVLVALTTVKLRIAQGLLASQSGKISTGAQVFVTGIPTLVDHYWWLPVRVGPASGSNQMGYCAHSSASGQEVFFKPLSVIPSTITEGIVDLSHNNDVNPALLRDQVIGVIHKATQGFKFVDPMYASRKVAFSGRLWGATHFGTAADPLLQADFFLSVTRPDGSFILVLDLEENPNMFEGTMSLEQAEVFVQRIKDRTGKWPVVYTRPGYLPARASILSNCPLYVSNQNMPPALPYQWASWKLNQYAQKIVSGTSSPIDFNRFAGTVDELNKWWSLTSPFLPSDRQWKLGFHVVQSGNWFAHRDFLLKMHSIGRLAGATIVNNTELANILVQSGVPYVVHRNVNDGNEGQPLFSGNISDKQIGKNAYWGNNQLKALDKRVYIQLFGCNEANRPNDGYFYLGACEEATADGRKLVCFNDPVGNPDMYQNPDGTVRCPTFKQRSDSGVLAYMKKWFHAYGYHGYGAGGGGANGATGNEPGSAIWPDGRRDDGQWFWFGGRMKPLYDTVDESQRPDIIITEAGFFNADFNLGGGTNGVLNDLNGYQIRYGADKYCKSIAYWTLGDMGGWAHSDCSPAMDAIYNKFKTQNP